MADDDRPEVVAPAPTEWGKNLRCCVTCRLVKTLDQFYETGCENCPFLSMEGDTNRIYDCTSTEFQGLAAIIDPPTSWSAKWMRARKCVPGCYALSVHADLSPEIMEILEQNGIRLREEGQ